MKHVWTSELLSSIPCVSHAFFGRKFNERDSFEKTSDVAHEFNCSKFIGDDPKIVAENLEQAKNFLEAKKLVTLKQVHGNQCVIADESTESGIEADALVTKTEGIAIGIATADCTPVVLVDPIEKIIGIAHAGWKGAAAGVIQSTVSAMISLGSALENIYACLGPAISVKNYEVSPDFKENFAEHIKKAPHIAECFHEDGEKLHFDIPEFCKRTLLMLGISSKKIDRLKIDTYDNVDKFFSYRYEREHPNCAKGRFLSAIVLK